MDLVSAHTVVLQRPLRGDHVDSEVVGSNAKERSAEQAAAAAQSQERAAAEEQHKKSLEELKDLVRAASEEPCGWRKRTVGSCPCRTHGYMQSCTCHFMSSVFCMSRLEMIFEARSFDDGC